MHDAVRRVKILHTQDIYRIDPKMENYINENLWDNVTMSFGLMDDWFD
jgi:hypothetical protein